jgi:hypothetical protein
MGLHLLHGSVTVCFSGGGGHKPQANQNLLSVCPLPWVRLAWVALPRAYAPASSPSHWAGAGKPLHSFQLLNLVASYGMMTNLLEGMWKQAVAA